MRRQYFIAWVGLVCLLGSVPVWAEDAKTSVAVTAASAVPRLVRFSGVAKEAAGEPQSGVVDLTFSLYREEGGGEALWYESQTVQTDVQGRYTVLLGAMHPDGLPMDLFTSGEARWLGVSVGKLPEQPRVLLVSVPYAMKAEDAAKLGGKKASDFVLTEQLKEEVKTAVSLQVVPVEKAGATKEAALTAPADELPKLVVASGQSSFTCSTTTPCVSVSQSSTGSGVQSVAKTLAVYGLANATTGTTYGMRGQTPSTTGRGVFGYATATTGGTIGVYGLAPSTSGVAVLGDANATTGATRGVIGRTSSASGIGAWGYATKTSGTTTGVRGDVWSLTGTAGYFDNRAGGKILSGRANGAEKFRVMGNGDIWSAGNTATVGNVTGGAGSFTTSGGTGVYGSGSSEGVFGAGASSGVVGYSSNGDGVYGEGYYSGVYGYSQDYTGVYGSSSNGTGVNGYSSNGNGVDGFGYYTGVYGYSQDFTGVVGDSSTGDGVDGYGYYAGVYGQTNAGYEFNSGVWGQGYYDGVFGHGETDAGVYGESPVYGVYGSSDAAGGGIAVYADGDFVASGTKSAIVPLAENRVVTLYAMESPENWFEDFGSGQLHNGAAGIALDPTFAETVNTESGYHVFLTANGNCEGLYVASKSAAGFEVRELRGGKSEVAFDYRIVAHRRGFETVRLRQVEADTEVVKKLRDRMAAASSAKPPKLILHKPMERSKKPERPKRATRPARMTFPQLPNAPGLMKAPQGLNLGAPSN